MRTKPAIRSSRPILAALALALALASCSKPAPPPESRKQPPGGYPLTTCLVSGEELGSKGNPVTLDYSGTVVKFCCKECLPKFNADPQKYLAKLRPPE